jgi:hypothetical protein
MPEPRARTLIRDWGKRLQAEPLAARVIVGLRGRRDEIWRGAFDLLQRECPEYRNAVDDEFTAESKSHCGELLDLIVAVAAGRTDHMGTDPFGFVRTHAQWRARHGVPLSASLHAYRLAHRTYWALTREAVVNGARQKEAISCLTMLSDFWIEFFDVIGGALAEAHAVEEKLFIAQNTRAHLALIENLLRGIDPKDAEAQRLCALCGIVPGAPLAVALARPVHPPTRAQIDVEPRLRSLVRLLEQALPATSFGKLIDIRNGEVAAIVSSADGDTARRMVSALRASGFDRRAANGSAACIGISLDAAELDRLPQALDEARLAIDFAGGARPVMLFADIDLPEFLIRRAETAAFRLIPTWAHHVSDAHGGQSGELSRTIRAFAACSLNVKQAARRLGVHTNTVYFRLNRINELTGVDPRTYAGTSLLLTTLRLLEIQGKGAEVS